MNEHVAKYIEQYLYTPGKPEYAVYLKGSWGSGKTHFVSHLLQLVDVSKIGHNEIARISVYGLTSLIELDEKMFQAIHPVLSSDTVQFLGSFARTALRLGANFDINADGKSDGSITLGGLPKKRKIQLSKLRKRLFVIDDLERSNIDVSLIFGYFSEMILDHSVRVIFIGNDDKVHDQDENKRTNYLKVKEKVIGAEFVIEPDIQAALDSFAEDIPLGNRRDLVIEEIARVIGCLRSENLRNARQCIFHIRFFLSALPANLQEALIRDIVSIYAVLFLQKASGAITRDQVTQAVGSFSRYGLSLSEMESTRKKELEGAFAFMFLKVPLLNSWARIVFDGWISPEFISSQIQIELNENSPQSMSSLFRLMNSWRESSAEGFSELLASANSDFNNGGNLHPGEILHYYCTLCLFSRLGLVSETIEEVRTRVEQRIAATQGQITAIEDWELLSHGYGGWGFNYEIPHFSVVKARLVEISRARYNEKVRADIIETCQGGNSTISDMVRKLANQTRPISYYGVPVLSLMGSSGFLEYFGGLSSDNKDLIIECLEERYGKKYSNGTLRKEYFAGVPVLESIVASLELEELQILGDPQQLMKQNHRRELRAIHDYCKAFLDRGAT